MKLLLSFFTLLFSFVVAYGQPKGVKNAYRSVAGIVTYKNGVVKANTTALFVMGNGDVMTSGKIFEEADSAVVIDNNGKVYPVRYIVGADVMYDCIKVRIAHNKKIKYLAPSASRVNVGDELYMLSYGVKKNVAVEPFRVLAVDSVYSLAYYTLDRPVEERFLAYPLLNGNGEFVALMQPSSVNDTLKGYAVSSLLSSSLFSSAKNYGKGYYPGMEIRTAMPDVKEDALSCLYMQTMIGDSISWIEAINDYIASYPESYEGYQSLAEYTAVYYRDMEQAGKAWEKALSLADNKAEVYFGKGKVINEIVQSGDTVSHPTLSFDNALAQVDKAIAIDNRPLYLSYKADMLYRVNSFDKAVGCYRMLASTDMRAPDVFAKASQCYMQMNEPYKAIEMLDSAVTFFENNSRDAAPYILTRAMLKSSSENYREAVLDMNRYEELVGGLLNADFYYIREQAELNCKMYQQALNDIEKVIDLVPDNVLYYIEKGMLCYRVKLTDEGLRTMLKARELAPEMADVHYLLGRLYMQQGNSDRARESLVTAERLGHSDARKQIDSLK